MTDNFWLVQVMAATLGLLLVWIALLCTLSAVLSMWEKRLISRLQRIADSAPPPSALNDANPYAAPPFESAAPEPDGYAVRSYAAAESAGFQWVGAYRDAKGGVYRVRYELWQSPQSDVLAIIANGTVAGIRAHAASLCTLLADGRCLKTVDHVKGCEFDPARLIDEALIAKTSFSSLLSYHERRIGAAGVARVAHAADDPLRDYVALAARRADRLVELRLAEFVDDERTAWRYTFKGAWVFAIGNTLSVLRRSIWSDKRRRIFRQRAATEAVA